MVKVVQNQEGVRRASGLTVTLQKDRTEITLHSISEMNKQLREGKWPRASNREVIESKAPTLTPSPLPAQSCHHRNHCCHFVIVIITTIIITIVTVRNLTGRIYPTTSVYTQKERKSKLAPNTSERDKDIT